MAQVVPTASSFCAAAWSGARGWTVSEDRGFYEAFPMAASKFLSLLLFHLKNGGGGNSYHSCLPNALRLSRASFQGDVKGR